eukprot:2621061-Amphidinium_carterae.1
MANNKCTQLDWKVQEGSTNFRKASSHSAKAQAQLRKLPMEGSPATSRKPLRPYVCPASKMTALEAATLEPTYALLSPGLPTNLTKNA